MHGWVRVTRSRKDGIDPTLVDHMLADEYEARLLLHACDLVADRLLDKADNPKRFYAFHASM